MHSCGCALNPLRFVMELWTVQVAKMRLMNFAPTQQVSNLNSVQLCMHGVHACVGKLV